LSGDGTNTLNGALEQLNRLLSEHPAAASAVLVGLAVERGVLDQGRARALAKSVDLADFQQVKSVLAAEVQRAGRGDELVDLLTSARRIQRFAGELLHQAGHD
jgi:hypothetical protein